MVVDFNKRKVAIGGLQKFSAVEINNVSNWFHLGETLMHSAIEY